MEIMTAYRGAMKFKEGNGYKTALTDAKCRAKAGKHWAESNPRGVWVSNRHNRALC